MRNNDAALLAEAAAAAVEPGLAARAIPLLDLTTLKGDESAAEIDQLCADAKRAGVAAICVYEPFIDQSVEALRGTGVAIASVANFPDGSDDIEAASEEAKRLVAAGASEVDLVIPIEAAQDGDVAMVGEMVEAVRGAIGRDVALKCILETGVLERPDLITAAARAAVMAGCDMLKTSTGKSAVGATPEAALALLRAAEEADGRIGVKISGGVRTAQDASTYLALADAVLGPDWATPKTFRFGASSLLRALEALERER